MKTNLLVLTFLLALATLSKAQSRFTPYDQLPGIDKTAKPAFSKYYTGWEKMLYQYPVNYVELKKDYEQYIKQNPNEKSALVRYYKIWSRVIEYYANAKGEIILQGASEWKNNLRKAQLNADQKIKSATTSNGGWNFLGPVVTTWLNDPNISEDRLDKNGHPKECPWQANVYSFDIARTNPDILFCGTETGYVNKSTDRGLTWEPVGLGYPFGGGITAVAIHPNSPDTVYVCGGDQVHKTVNGGSTWTPLLTTNITFSASRLKINPQSPDILVASASEGLFLSFNKGSSWTKKWSKPVFDAEFKPGSPDTIYALTRNSVGNFELIVSTNNGQNFSVASDFPNSYTESAGGLLAVTHANPGIMYATLLSGIGDDGIPYILKGTETNGSFSWEQKKKGQLYSVGGLGGFTNGQGYFDLVLEASPNDENTVFWGTCSLWKSTDGGSNYTPVGGYSGNFPIHPDIQDMKILDNGEMWVATDGGMNHSTDYFSNPVNYSSRSFGILGSDMWGFDQGWNEDIVVGGRYHNGNTALTDFYDGKALRMGGGESPTGWVIKGKSRHVAYNDLGNGWILPDKSDGYAEGRFVFSKFPNMDEYGGRRGNLVQHPNYYGTIYLGEENGFWKSTDMGQSFDLLHQFPGRVRYLQVSPSNPDVFYADIVNYGLYRSSNGGVTWERKPALTNGTYANASWNGKLFFVISPTNEDKIYVCLQNGTWSNEIGKIYRSEDGGNTWTDWTSGVQEYTKCMVIQPAQNSGDLVYLFTTSRNGENSKVYSRYEKQPYWNDFSMNYPAGISVNTALPFYRDSKIRVAGNAGIWETKMVDTTFVPVINPWVEKAVYDCMEDTLYFDDHSILNHDGATWNWEINPQPVYIDDPESRNPKVVLGNPGSYDVTLTVTVNGEAYQKTIQDMVQTTTCPSVNDCSNPANLDKSQWDLLYVDSEETTGDDGKAINAFDGDPDSFWHTEWYYSSPGHPHEIQIDLGDTFQISSLTYLPRQNSSNGRIKDYEIYISDRTDNWGSPVQSGAFDDGTNPKTLTFASKSGRYFKLKSLSEQNGNNWTAIAEIDLKGCYDKTITSANEISRQEIINVFPVPCNDFLNIKLPHLPQNEKWLCRIFNSTGKIVQQKEITLSHSLYSFDVHQLASGIYYMMIRGQNNREYRIKFIKD